MRRVRSAVEGVLDVFTHEHRPQLASADEKIQR